MQTHETLQRWVKAHNAKDVGYLKSLYAADSMFQLTGTLAISTRESAFKMAEFDYATKTQRDVRTSWIIGDEIQAEVTERSALLEAAGIHEAHYNGQFIVRGGLIASVQLEPTAETRQATDRALSQFVAWASTTRPQRLAQVMPGGRLRYDAETGRQMLDLMCEWKRATS
jgi:hypothetical protein